jgi:vesicle-fusing ATPase
LIDFPLPGTEERLRIWKQVMPPGVDVSEIDFEFLANRFSVAGGHIRSIVLHACLQAARPGGPRKLTMKTIILAVKREFDKLERATSLEQYGDYASIASEL